MDRKRSETERQKGARNPPSPEDIQSNLDDMAGAVRNLQDDVDALIKRPNVLPWRRKPTDADQQGK